MINKVIFILLCLCAVRANAQKEVQTFEGGLNLGMCVPVMPYHHGTSEAGFCFGVSGRYNFPYSEWSVGLDIQLNPMRRNFDVKHDGHLLQPITIIVGLIFSSRPIIISLRGRK